MHVAKDGTRPLSVFARAVTEWPLWWIEAVNRKHSQLSCGHTEEFAANPPIG
jgi:hypothetical protein